VARYRVVDLVTGETLLLIDADSEDEVMRRYLDRCANRAAVEREGPPDEVVPVSPSDAALDAVPEWVDPETTPSEKPKIKTGKN
jgi:hypothetical protein